jgi:hypothetical protein
VNGRPGGRRGPGAGARSARVDHGQVVVALAGHEEGAEEQRAHVVLGDPHAARLGAGCVSAQGAVRRGARRWRARAAAHHNGALEEDERGAGDAVVQLGLLAHEVHVARELLRRCARVVLFARAAVSHSCVARPVYGEGRSHQVRTFKLPR